jgi:hypothetical protein
MKLHVRRNKRARTTSSMCRWTVALSILHMNPDERSIAFRMRPNTLSSMKSGVRMLKDEDNGKIGDIFGGRRRIRRSDWKKSSVGSAKD